MIRLKRRGLLKLAALAAAAVAPPTWAQEAPIPFKQWKTQWKLGEIGGKTDILKAKVVPSICPYCSMGCSIDVYNVGGKIVYTRGSPESYINWGALCPKGQAAFQLVESGRRVLYPLVRTGPKPPPEEILAARTWDELVAVVKKYPPQWRPATWDEALRYIAQKTTQILDQHRKTTGTPNQPDGTYYKGAETPIQIIGSSALTNEEAYLVAKLAVYLGTTNLDSQYRKCHSSTVTALALTYGFGAETASIEDVAHADVVLFFSNPAEAHPLSFAYFAKAKERGAIFIVCDPRFSRTATYADLWVPFRSGSDTALLNYILYYAFFERNPPIDQLDAFKAEMDRWNVTWEDLEDLKAVIREYPAEVVSRISGVPVEKLRKMAELYVENSGVVSGHRRHGVIQWAMGFTQHTDSTLSIIRAAAIVQLLLGNVGYVGGGTHPFRGHSNVQGATDVQGNGMGGLPGYYSNPMTPLSVRVYQDWKLQGMPDAWNWEVPTWARDKPPFSLIERPERGRTDINKALQVYSFYGWRRLELAWGLFCGTLPEDDPENGRAICDFPLGIGNSEVSFMRRALEGRIRAAFIFAENPAVTNPNSRLAMAALASLDLLVVSDIFETETAWFADVLLPAASFAEKDGSRTNGNRVIQWSFKAVNPRGDSRPDYWIIVKLFEYLVGAGAVLLPSRLVGVGFERVVFRRGGRLVHVYDRPVVREATWDYRGGTGTATPAGTHEAEANPRLIHREINFAMLIYQGIWNPIKDEYTAMRRSNILRRPGEIDGTFSSSFQYYKDWGWSWPMNVRSMYNLRSLEAQLGRAEKVVAAGREWTVTGETGEILDEFTGEYRPFSVPGHNYFIPKIFKRRLSGVADLFGGVDLVRLVREGRPVFLGRFVVEEDGQVKTLTYEEYAARTGMKYLWANDTVYIDEEAQSIAKAALKRPFFSGSPYREAKPMMDQFKAELRRAYESTGDIAQAVRQVMERFGRWYPGYNFQWPIHTEPVEGPDIELQLEYPTIAWLHPHNLKVLFEEPDIVRGKPVGVAHDPKDLEDVPGELVVVTSHRLTEHFHSGAMTRNVPYLAELVPEPYAQIPEPLAQKLGIKSGDHITIETARGTIKMRALVSRAERHVSVGGRELPVVSLVWSFGFAGAVTGPAANLLSPDLIDPITSIQESKAWLGKVRKAV